MAKREDTQFLLAIASAALGGLGLAYAVTAKGPGGGGGQTYAVDFYVYDSGNHPVSGAVVQLGTAVQSTNTSGLAAFQGILAGSYSVSVTAFGYDPVNESVTVSSTATSFNVSMTTVTPCTGTCLCGQVWDPITCQCEAAKPAAINMESTDSFNQDWYIHIDRNSIQGFIGACVAPVSGDPGCNGTCGDDSIAAVIPVQVVDAAGSPVCGAVLNGSLSVTTIPWRTLDGCMSGHVEMSLESPSEVTDSNGNTSFGVVFKLVVENETCGGFCGGCCGGHNLAQNFQTALFVNVLKTQLKAAATVTMFSHFYGYAYCYFC